MATNLRKQRIANGCEFIRQGRTSLWLANYEWIQVLKKNRTYRNETVVLLKEKRENQITLREKEGNLIQPSRNDHFKFRYVDIKAEFVNGAFHEIGAMHTAHISGKVAGRFIFINITGHQDRLLANNTFAFYFTVLTR